MELNKLIQIRDSINANIIIGIENKAKFMFDRQGRVRFSYDLNARSLVDIIAKYRSKKVVMVLDTCHLLGYHRSISIMDNNYSWIKEFNSDLDYILSKGVVEYIHLNNAIDLGVTKMTHSSVFKTEEDKCLLKDIVDKLKKYSFTGKIVAEVNEKDYNKPVNTRYSIDLYKEVLMW
ncbi:MAG: hypothetical protein QXD03_04520 [Candidatus Anstonellales archaeon]